ncbi:hypothetical protein Tco_1313632 [Tanacetum coccineum]
METKDTLSSCSNSEEQQMQQIQDKAKKSCMVSFRQLHSHLKLLSNNNLNGTRTESGFKRAFATLFGQDVETFIDTMFLNMDQLEKQLDKEEFQEIGSMASFKVLETQFQMFIKSRMYMDDEYVVMTRNYFLQYTQLEIPEFRDTLIQHMESVKKLIDERALHKREYDIRVNERQIQTTEGKVDTGKAVDANIIHIYDEEPMAEVQTTAEINVFATGQQYTEQPEFNIEGEVDQNVEQCHDTCPLPANVNDNQTTKLTNQSLEFENICLKKTVAQFKKDFSRMETHCVNLELKYQNQALKEGQHGQFSKVKSNEAKTTRAKNIEHTTSLIANNDKFKAQLQEKGFAIAALKNELRKLTGNSVNTKFAKSSILGKPVLQPRRNQSVVRQPTAFKSERPRFSKQRFASQVDVNNDLSKPVTTHYLPKERESAVAKPHHMIAPGSSRYSSNDMVHKHYLEEAKKKTQESSRNSEPSVMPSARSQSTTNEHSRNSRSFSDSKHFVCSTCQKCVFNANHDSCVTKFLNEVNLRAKVPSHKTTTRYKPVEQTSVAKKPERQIPIGHRFSIKKTFVVHEKTITPRSCLRWKPTGKIFKTVGLRWVPTGKIFTSSTTKVDSEPQNGSNDDITNQYECKQTLDVSAGTLNIHAGTSLNPTKEGLRVCSELGIHIPQSKNNQVHQSWFQSLSSSNKTLHATTSSWNTISPSAYNAEVLEDENTRKSVIEQHTYRQAENLMKSQSPRVDKRNWQWNIDSGNLGNGFEFNRESLFLNFVPTVVVTKLGQVPVNIAKKSSSRAAASISTTRPVNTVAPKSKVNDASPIKYSYFKAHSPIRRDFNQKLAAKTNNLNGKVKTARVNNVTTAGSKAEVNVAVGNGEIEGNPQYALHDQGIFDSGCSRHMTGTSPYLKIIKTLMVDLLHLQEVLKEKNSVLFTETECLVLSPDFKLLDESQVLLKVPRQNNMYSFDLKNIVPSGELTNSTPYNMIEHQSGDAKQSACEVHTETRLTCDTLTLSQDYNSHTLLE